MFLYAFQMYNRLIGNVHIGDYVWIGPGAVIRGDYGEISVGSYSEITHKCPLVIIDIPVFYLVSP